MVRKISLKIVENRLKYSLAIIFSSCGCQAIDVIKFEWLQTIEFRLYSL
jgi:hypothetical protein